MLREATIKKSFGYKQEEAQNPYIGFTSFQHFQGDPLYSDSIVKPENNFTETEAFECYPIPENVPQNGLSEGFYPDSTIAYIRVLWKEFEPEDGVYNYAFIEDILAKAKAANQKLVFRLLPHSTRESDDVPDWLKKIIPCPARPAGVREKASPTDPRYLKYLGRVIRKFGERFDSDPTLEYMDISLTGSWGEGSHREGFPDEDLYALMDVYVESFPKTQLIGQLGALDLLEYVNKFKPTAWRADGIGHPGHLREIYPPRLAKVPPLWKKAPISLESYWWLGEWQRKEWDLDYIIETTLSWHISSFNGKSLPIPFEWREKVQGWINKMGYHFRPVTVEAPAEAAKGDDIQIKLTMENYGVAPIYHDIPLNVRLTGEGGTYVVNTGADLREWLPGTYDVEVIMKLAEDIKSGTYDIEIGICDEEHPMIYMCTDAERDGAYYKVGCITIA